MKVAISSSGTTLQSNVDPRFGRCPYFIFYDTDSDTFEHIDNQARQAMGGAGIQTGQLIEKYGVKVVITGNVGPNAFRVLSSASIKVYSGVSGKVNDAIKKLKEGKLTETSAPDVGSHFGMGQK